MSDTSKDADVRDRVLAVANDLFYREGVHRVPLERVVEVAGVSVEDALEAFGGEDGLVLAYLRERHRRAQDAIQTGLPAYDSPRGRLVGVFEIQGRTFSEPGFRGCAIVSASGQAWPGEVIEVAAREYRDWLHNLFFGLAFEAQARHPERLAQQLVVLYDGGGIAAWMDRRPSTVAATMAMAETLVEAALAS